MVMQLRNARQSVNTKTKQQAAAEGHQQAVAGIIEPAGTMIPKEAPQALGFHPLADLFPLMMGNEFGELVADIKANGLREKITLYKGKILEGRNRYRACREAGVKVETDDFDGDEPRRYSQVHRTAGAEDPDPRCGRC